MTLVTGSEAMKERQKQIKVLKESRKMEVKNISFVIKYFVNKWFALSLDQIHWYAHSCRYVIFYGLFPKHHNVTMPFCMYYKQYLFFESQSPPADNVKSKSPLS